MKFDKNLVIILCEKKQRERERERGREREREKLLY